MQVSVYGDTAIATAIFDGKGTDSAGKPVERARAIYRRLGEDAVRRLACVATHGSLIKK